MTGRKIAQIRRTVIRFRDELDEEAQRKKRMPWWARAALFIGLDAPFHAWNTRWERRHAAALQIATRKAAAMMAARG